MVNDIVQSTQFDWFSLFRQGGFIGVGIMICLLLLSLWTWAVILSKMRSLRNAHMLSEKFLANFWEAKSLSELNLRVRDMEYSPAREVFRAGFNEMIRILQAREKKGGTGPVYFETVKRALSRQKIVEENQLSAGIGILAICASAGPFIGLLGTVIGIIRAFHEIGVSGSTSLASVAPGISEALVATAMGLFLAIPAVIFYNVLVSKIRRLLVLLEGFSADFINILERHYSIKADKEES